MRDTMQPRALAHRHGWQDAVGFLGLFGAKPQNRQIETFFRVRLLNEKIKNEKIMEEKAGPSFDIVLF